MSSMSPKIQVLFRAGNKLIDDKTWKRGVYALPSIGHNVYLVNGDEKVGSTFLVSNIEWLHPLLVKINLEESE